MHAEKQSLPLSLASPLHRKKTGLIIAKCNEALVAIRTSEILRESLLDPMISIVGSVRLSDARPRV